MLSDPRLIDSTRAPVRVRSPLSARLLPTRSDSLARRMRPTAIWGMPATVPRRSESDRKSTRLNSSHVRISYAVFCLKKKKHSLEQYDFSKIKNKVKVDI